MNEGRDPEDALLDSVDLSTYGLERVKLNEHIGLDADETDLDPENPNVRGYRGGDKEMEPLDQIIQLFNERWFAAWNATPEEQRIKFLNILKHVRKATSYDEQVLNNPDVQNRRLAQESLIGSAINKERRRELDLYKLYASDPEFKKALNDSLIRILNLEDRRESA